MAIMCIQIFYIHFHFSLVCFGMLQTSLCFQSWECPPLSLARATLYYRGDFLVCQHHIPLTLFDLVCLEPGKVSAYGKCLLCVCWKNKWVITLKKLVVISDGIDVPAYFPHLVVPWKEAKIKEMGIFFPAGTKQADDYVLCRRIFQSDVALSRPTIN